jgi:DNA topoisomerase-1
LNADDSKRRRIATAVYLIDALGLRVGDEKDPDEADTVGATTLRPEHVTLRTDGAAEFRFLGKDSVLWDKELALPETVQRNLADLIQNAQPHRAVKSDKRHPTRDKPQLFPGVSSHDVNLFLGEVLPGLTAKVFRTHHATDRVERSLAGSGVTRDDPEHKKWQVTTLANVEAASFCNHTRKASEGWRERRDKLVQRQQAAEDKLGHQRKDLVKLKAALAKLCSEARSARKSADNKTAAAKMAARYQKKTASMERKVAACQQRLERQQLALGKLKSQTVVAGKARAWNLTTSLKSYIDPRVFYRWGKSVDYDVLGRYYSSTLQRKFSWVRREGDEQEEPSEA